MTGERAENVASELRRWAMTHEEALWRSHARAVSRGLGAEVVPVALELMRRSMEPASAAFGARLLGEIDGTRPELAYRAAGELACEVFGLAAAASEHGPRWGNVLQHLLVAVARLPTWAGYDRLLAHSGSWVDGVHAGEVLGGTDRCSVSGLGALARLDPSEAVQVFVGLLLLDRLGDSAGAERARLGDETRHDSVRALLAGEPMSASMATAVEHWVEQGKRASALLPVVGLDDLREMLRDEDRCELGAEVLARWGEGQDRLRAEQAAELLEAAVDPAPSASLRGTIARARTRTEVGTAAERSWFLRFDEREQVRRTLAHALSGDEERLSLLLDDPSDIVASWAVLALGDLEAPKRATVGRVLAVASERAGSDAAADAIFVCSNRWADRVSEPAYIRAVRANLSGTRWDVEVLMAIASRPALELVAFVRDWEPTSEYEAELRLEALEACEKAPARSAD